jgi:hypothetical protein
LIHKSVPNALCLQNQQIKDNKNGAVRGAVPWKKDSEMQ